METFEAVLMILAGALVLRALSDRLAVPSPVMLAFGGAAVALVPGMPEIDLDPGLVLALFVAPILLDAAYDTSLRDLRRTWLPVASLVFMAVAVTTAAVALVVKLLVPEMPFAAAVALGAIVAPPDAASAISILRQVRVPHKLVVVLEGESLLNDASALLVYRLAVGAAVGGTLDGGMVLSAVVLGLIGSVVAGFAIARTFLLLSRAVTDPPTSIILQFLSTFGVWILAEHLGLSPIVTVVVHGITIARSAPGSVPASMRIASYAVWDTVVLVLNVFAFVLIGLQLRAVAEELTWSGVAGYAFVGLAALATAIAARVLWVMLYHLLSRVSGRFAASTGPQAGSAPTFRGATVVSWCGMRGIVTLAAALALPPDMPFRGLILFCAFVVTLGTLTLQGLTLKPLIAWLRLPPDDTVEREVDLAWSALSDAAARHLKASGHAVAAKLAPWFADAQESRQAAQAIETLRAETIAAQRSALIGLRSRGTIGDTAFHRVEEALDWSEAAARRRAQDG